MCFLTERIKEKNLKKKKEEEQRILGRKVSWKLTLSDTVAFNKCVLKNEGGRDGGGNGVECSATETKGS